MTDNLVIPVGIDIGSMYARVAVGEAIDLETEEEIKLNNPTIVTNAQGVRYTLALSAKEELYDHDGEKMSNKAEYIFGESARRYLNSQRKSIEPNFIHNLLRSISKNTEEASDDPDLQACAHFFFHLGELACHSSTNNRSSDAVQPSQLRMIISVPPHFSEAEQLALKRAFKLGIQKLIRQKQSKRTEKLSLDKILLGLIANPAASMNANGLASSGTESSEKQWKDCICVDWGASGMTISHLQLCPTSELITLSDTFFQKTCAGTSMVDEVAKHCASMFQMKNRRFVSSPTEVLNNKRSIVKLHTVCQDAIKTLTRSNTAHIAIDGLYDGIDFTMSLSKPKFEMLVSSVLRVAQQTISQFLALCSKNVISGQIDKAVLSGSVFEMPSALNMVHAFFPSSQIINGNKTSCPMPVDECIACGSARYAQQILLSEKTYKKELEDVAETKEDIPLHLECEVSPITIGLMPETDDGTENKEIITPLIECGTPLPVHVSKIINLPLVESSKKGIFITQTVKDTQKVLAKIASEDVVSEDKMEVTMELSTSGKLSLSINGGEVIVF